MEISESFVMCKKCTLLYLVANCDLKYIADLCSEMEPMGNCATDSCVFFLSIRSSLLSPDGHDYFVHGFVFAPQIIILIRGIVRAQYSECVPSHSFTVEKWENGGGGCGEGYNNELTN